MPSAAAKTSLSAVDLASVGQPTPPIALSIAGFDPSSGAGGTADLQTFAAHGVFGLSALTALTVQSTRGVRRTQVLDAALLEETLECLEADLAPAGVKIGMLGSSALVTVVARYLTLVRARRPVYVVLDPVLRSSSGAALLDDAGVQSLGEQLLPLCDCATPNRSELDRLTNYLGGGVRGEGELLGRARDLQARVGGLELIVTGGDEEGTPTDLLLGRAGGPVWLTGARVQTRATHGTGCAFSSALLSRRLLGDDLHAAALGAKRFVEGALRTAPRVGSGRGPMNLLWTRPLR